MTGNALKAGVRFVSYDRFKQMLVDQDVSLAPFPADCAHESS